MLIISLANGKVEFMPLETSLQVAGTIIASYLVGAIPFGYLIGLINGVDIRKEGSGNIGATNVTRVIGKWWGRVCFILDFLKGMIPVVAVSLLIRQGCLPDKLGILPSLAALSTVCGHIWPIYLGFKGGKGISTAAGAIMALNPPALLCAGIVWVVVFFASRYVSLASVAAAVSLPVFCFLFMRMHVFENLPPAIFSPASKAEFILFCLLAGLTVIKHKSNIKRLLDGTESRFDKKPREQKSTEG